MAEVNPESMILEQLREHWQRIATLLVIKAGGHVTIDQADLAKSAALMDTHIMLTHGHADSVEFKIIPKEEGERLAAYDATRMGRA